MATAKKTTAKTTKTTKTAKTAVMEIKDDGATQEVSQAANSPEGQPDQEVTEVVAKEAATTKAGKHSAKAQKEAEAKEAKEERKAHAKADSEVNESKPKTAQNPPRTQLQRKGKKYRQLAEQIDKSKQYSLTEAIGLAVKTNPAKFDAAVELHVRLGVDPRHADQNIRDMVVLPSGTGKSVRVAVMADPEGAAAAKKAGAEIVGEEAVLGLLDKGNLDFDILISQPMLMAKLGKYARVLGPKGLMPNPKSGTVSADVAKAVTEAKAGRVEFRVDSTGIVHLAIGKVSFGPDKLVKNAKAIFSSLKAAKPASVKGNYVLAIFATTSMGPSISILTSEI